MLAVSRSFGDILFKCPRLTENETPTEVLEDNAVGCDIWNSNNQIISKPDVRRNNLINFA